MSYTEDSKASDKEGSPSMESSNWLCTLRAKPEEKQPEPELGVVRRSYIDYLDEIFELVRDSKEDSPFLKKEQLQSLSIQCHHLLLTSHESCSHSTVENFFQPLSQDELEAHPIDDINEPRMASRAKLAEELLELSAAGDVSLIEGADMVMSHVRWQFSCPRTGLSRRSLCDKTPWRPGDSDYTIFHQTFNETLFEETSPRWSPVGAWKIHPEVPHTMFCLHHDVEGEEMVEGEGMAEDEEMRSRWEPLQPLRGEILAILAAMITRLELPNLSDRVTIPVLVFSFMGKRKCRILQAFCNQTGLIVSMSQLFEFATLVEARKSTQVVLLHLANSPVGKTTYNDVLPELQLALRGDN